jgi:hypothetical protein
VTGCHERRALGTFDDRSDTNKTSPLLVYGREKHDGEERGMGRKIRGLRASVAAALALIALTGLGSAAAETSSPPPKAPPRTWDLRIGLSYLATMGNTETSSTGGSRPPMISEVALADLGGKGMIVQTKKLRETVGGRKPCRS